MIWQRRYQLTRSAYLDNSRLADEFDHAAVAVNSLNLINSGKADWEFKPNVGPDYSFTNDTYGKFVEAKNTNNENDFICIDTGTGTLVASDVQFTLVQVPTLCQALTYKGGVAKAILWSVTFMPGDNAGAGMRVLRNNADAGYAAANGLFIRDGDYLINASISEGHQPFAPDAAAGYTIPTPTATNTLDATLRAEVCVRNRPYVGSAGTESYIEVRVGTLASGSPAAVAYDAYMTFRLVGFYV